MAKEVPEPSLREVLTGVDIIGTILHTDLPRLEAELSAIRSDLARQPPSGPSDSRNVLRGSEEMTVTLEEIRDLLQLQLDRLDVLERRVAHLADVCTRTSQEQSEPG
jgi:hypothetical protein